MARQVKGYRVDTKKKVVILFTNIKRTKADELIIGTYINNGYKVRTEKKTTVEMMKKELKEKDKTAYEKFVKLYTTNEEDGALGFHRACKFYSDWKKEQATKKEDK